MLGASADCVTILQRPSHCVGPGVAIGWRVAWRVGAAVVGAGAGGGHESATVAEFETDLAGTTGSGCWHFLEGRLRHTAAPSGLFIAHAGFMDPPTHLRFFSFIEQR